MNQVEMRANLEEMGVHDLRNVARIWGVKSPTSKVKSILIEEVLKIAFSKSENVTAFFPSKGRKAKSSYFNENLFKLLPHSIMRISNSRNFEINESQLQERDIAFNSQDEDCHFPILDYGEGFVRNIGDCYYYIEQKTDKIIYIPNPLIIDHELEYGDLIKTGILNSEKNVYIANYLIELNKTPIEKVTFPRKLCLERDVAILDNLVKNDGYVEGTKTYVQIKSVYDYISKIIPTMKKFIANGFSIKTLAVKLSIQEGLLITKEIPTGNFISFQDDDPMHSYETITNCLQNAMLSARLGEKVLIVVANLSTIYDELKLFFSLKNKEQNANLATAHIARKMMGIPRTLKNKGSLTLIITSQEETMPVVVE